MILRIEMQGMKRTNLCFSSEVKLANDEFYLTFSKKNSVVYEFNTFYSLKLYH
jgi:hypothetical protein